MYKSVGSSAAQAQEECMPALFALHRVVFIIEVQDVLLCLEAELLVEQHGRVARRYVEGHILSHAGLNEMVDHECGDTSSPPFRMHQQEGDVGLVVFHIRHHEAKTDHDFLVKHHHTEIWVLEAL